MCNTVIHFISCQPATHWCIIGVLDAMLPLTLTVAYILLSNAAPDLTNRIKQEQLYDHCMGQQLSRFGDDKMLTQHVSALA